MNEGVLMTSQEFLEELQSVRDRFKWTLLADMGWEYIERRRNPRFHLRGSHNENSLESSFEPIGAVCWALTGRTYSPDQWPQAAAAIGLSVEVAGDLIKAANDQTWVPNDGARVPDTYLHSLRAQLLRVLHVEEHSGYAERIRQLAV